MTKEEQTDWLCRLRTDLNNGVIFTPWNKEFTEALTSILEQEPCEDVVIDKHYWKGFNNGIRTEKFRESKRQEPCGDAISRKAVLEIYDEWFATCNIADKKESPKSKIKALLPVTPKLKTGHWIDDGQYADGHSEHAYRCSKCGHTYIGYADKYKECPNCSAKMTEGGGRRYRTLLRTESEDEE